MLSISIETGNEFNGYYETIIKDAKLIRSNPVYVNTIRRETYRYSVHLAKSRDHFLEKINPAKISADEYKLLLDFFESL